MRVTHDRHIHGLFGRADWLRLLREAGFEPALRPFEHSELPAGSVVVFAGYRPPRAATYDRSARPWLESNIVLITDHTWPDVQVETALLSAAGLEVVDAPHPTKRR